MEKKRRFLLIVPNGGALFESTGVADILNMANLQSPPDSVPYCVTVATTQPAKIVCGRSGIRLLADVCLTDIDTSESWDTIVVTNRVVAPDEDEVLVEWITKASRHCRRLVSICAGALILARAGLLAGRRATTHWQHFDTLAALSPTTEVDRNSIFVRDGTVWTSAGASSGFDLTLALVEEDLGPEVARAVARDLVLYLRRPGGQAQFSRFLAAQADPDTQVGRVQLWAMEHLEQDLSVERLAAQAAMSPRNFCRVFVRETGITPARFIEEIRLEAARQHLEQGHESLDEIASVCGLGTSLNLRRAFERNLGVTPSDYRLRFGMI